MRVFTKRAIFPFLDIENHENGSFFFIENTFFNDTRKPENRVLSRNIVENQKKNVFPSFEPREGLETKGFEDAKMQDFKFIDLNVKIGKVYLYRHNESCDHMVVFKDFRLR